MIIYRLKRDRWLWPLVGTQPLFHVFSLLVIAAQIVGPAVVHGLFSGSVVACAVSVLLSILAATALIVLGRAECRLHAWQTLSRLKTITLHDEWREVPVARSVRR